MRTAFWLRSLAARLTRIRTSARHVPQRSAFRTRLEGLEDRTTPSGGLLDLTFGSGGSVLNSLGSLEALTDVSALPGGKLLTAGYVHGDFAAARYNADGSFDPSFGSGGLASVDFQGFSDKAMAVAVQPGTGGKILLAGTAQLRTGAAFGVVRLNPDGTLDSTFGTKLDKGKVTVSPVARVDNLVGGKAVLPDGRFILAGLAKNLGATSDGSIALARFNANGTLDTSFGTKGTVVSSIRVRGSGTTPDQHRVRVAVDSSGRLVVAGSAGDFLVTRFTPNGSLDTAFGPAHTGVVTTDVSGSVDFAFSLALQGDGKVVLGGLADQPDGDAAAALVRYNPDGSLDPTFDGDGIVTADSAPGYSSNAEADALVVQPDGKLVTAGIAAYEATLPGGSTYAGGNLVLAMRFNPDGSRDSSYGPSGTGEVMTLTGPNCWVSGAALQPDGRLVVVGSANTSLALTRFTGTTASPAPVQIGSFTASAATVTAGSPLTLTAGGITTTDAGATITKVAFYSVDSFGTEQLLGYGTSNADGTWTLSFTVNLAPGSYTLLALAADSVGKISDSLALSVTVQ